MCKVTIDNLIEIFEEVIDITGIKIDSNAVLGEDIPVDSTEMLRILSRIESRYRFRFEPIDVLGMKTLGDVFKVVRRGANTGC
ncbi:acyl carrier protein [bacterium]|nr:acyl carrier protein [bacterium]